MNEATSSFKRRKKNQQQAHVPVVTSIVSSTAGSSDPLTPFQWIQRLREHRESPHDNRAVQTLVQCVVLFPDQQTVVVDNVPLANLTAHLWGVNAADDRDMLHPFDVENRVLCEMKELTDVTPTPMDDGSGVRQGVYMVYNTHKANKYNVHIAATRILADQGLLELGCTPAIWCPDDPSMPTKEMFYERVVRYCTSLCPRGPVIFLLADVAPTTGPVPLTLTSSYFASIYPLLFRGENVYNRMLRGHPMFATGTLCIETLLRLNGSTAAGRSHQQLDGPTAKACRNELLVTVCGYSQSRLRSLTKTQNDEPQYHAVVCILVHRFSMDAWHAAARTPVTR